VEGIGWSSATECQRLRASGESPWSSIMYSRPRSGSKLSTTAMSASRASRDCSIVTRATSATVTAPASAVVAACRRSRAVSAWRRAVTSIIALPTASSSPRSSRTAK
jgi:hypothetical protein